MNWNSLAADVVATRRQSPSCSIISSAENGGSKPADGANAIDDRRPSCSKTSSARDGGRVGAKSVGMMYKQCGVESPVGVSDAVGEQEITPLSERSAHWECSSETIWLLAPTPPCGGSASAVRRVGVRKLPRPTKSWWQDGPPAEGTCRCAGEALGQW